MEKETSKWWWIGSHNTSDLSPWLRSTISELDAKTKGMLRVIEEEADSFAERAEMYYKKRPELIAMVEDLYRMYRSLAEKYDLARSSSLFKHAPPEKLIHVPEALEKPTYSEESWMIHVSDTPQKPTLSEESWMIHVPETPKSSTHKQESCFYESEIEEYAESEVDDGEEESGGDDDDECACDTQSMIDDDEAMAKMKEELEKLREENRVSSELLRQKDEEKREAIRQLSLAVEMLKEENLELKKRVSASAKQKEEVSPKKQLWSPFEFKKIKESVSWEKLATGFLGF
ncbi:PREDICTED: protein NETWORKED 3A-like [Tarenaya hassleriana]|uniref:protein NETWORKED 3A-like n=1 Tax=Tarenaya hassleriana TaxID=28532 RepID=UPI00053C2BCF|nr:PREDICTED: protein NETWORKED 3A-like [Tarenaya hassleriana]XP_019059605.1 PREDICTED: protein NETWORKED 3A-like [Tarenaya hassleriana]